MMYDNPQDVVAPIRDALEKLPPAECMAFYLSWVQIQQVATCDEVAYAPRPQRMTQQVADADITPFLATLRYAGMRVVLSSLISTGYIVTYEWDA